MSRGADQKLEVLSTLLTLVTSPGMVAEHVQMLQANIAQFEKIKEDAALLVARADAAQETLRALTKEEVRIEARRVKLEADVMAHKALVEENDEREKKLCEREEQVAMLSDTFEKCAENLDAREDDLRQRELIVTGRSNGGIHEAR